MRQADDAAHGVAPGKNPSILIVDDDAAARRTVAHALSASGFVSMEADDGPAALQSVADTPPAVVLLDINLPGMSGLEVLAELRRRSPALPVILVTGRGDEGDRVIGLELGGDDYIVKPFSLRELVARVRAVLRRTGPVAEAHAKVFGPLEIRAVEREILLHGEPIETTAKEFDLLLALAEEPRRVFSREELLDRVWGSKPEWQDPATVTEHMRRLRRKIEVNRDRPSWLVTVRGVGYRFEPPG